MWQKFFLRLKEALSEPDGHIWVYFQCARIDSKELDWERKLRDGYRQALGANGIGLKEIVLKHGKDYNAANQRFTNEIKEKAAIKIASEIMKLVKSNPPYLKKHLLNDAEPEILCNDLETAYDNLVEGSRVAKITKGQKKEINSWSWASKSLHFCFPHLFPIYDGNAEEAWKVVIPLLSLDSKRLTYGQICLLYKKIWDGLTASQQSELTSLQRKLKEHFQLSFFTMIDAFDKHFWWAGGPSDQTEVENRLF